MTLPRKGDRVRVALSERDQDEFAISPPVPVGSEGEVTEVRDDGPYRFEVHIPGIEIDWTWVPEQVEIVARAPSDFERGLRRAQELAAGVFTEDCCYSRLDDFNQAIDAEAGKGRT